MDKYSLKSHIASGSFGRVHEAVEIATGNIVALKTIEKGGYTRDEWKNFADECKIQRNLYHPNIIRMIESFETVDLIVVVSERADINLRNLLITDSPLPEARVQKLTWDLMSALYYLHSHRIVHRDLKPENILLNKDGSCARLCDFGLARNMNIQTHLLTSLKGTPLYMAPEMINGQPYDYRSDFWSIGCITYEMLEGNKKPPFRAENFNQLQKMVSKQYIIWPTILSDNCLSFLKGLLMKKPEDRFSWPEILINPFVQDHILLSEEKTTLSFTNPLTESQICEREKQRTELINKNKMKLAGRLPSQARKFRYIPVTKDGNATASSMDSIHAIVQTDVENIETDVEAIVNSQVNFVKATQNSPPDAAETSTQGTENNDLLPKEASASTNEFQKNLIVAPMDTNLEKYVEEDLKLRSTKEASVDGFHEPLPMSALQMSSIRCHDGSVVVKGTNKDLEKRKLNQNLDNFSVRLGTNVSECVSHVASNGLPMKDLSNSAKSESSQKKEKCMPAIEVEWDSSDDYQSPPIENEEWLAFLRKSIQEVLDGEFDSLKEESLVGIIVAILRNISASSKVIECVAQLLSLPLILKKAIADMEDIKIVYVRAKLVPNLVFASKLICCVKPIQSFSSTASSSNAPSGRKNSVYRPMRDLSNEEMKTLVSLYELTCHLVHLNDHFLSQFCDSVNIIASDLLVHFLAFGSENAISIRLVNSVIALLCCALRKLPENAELMEKIIFHKKVNIVEFLRSDNYVLKTRVCMLLRIVGRFSCCALQNAWSAEFRDVLELLANDPKPHVRNIAEEVIEEFRLFSFYKKT